MSEVRSLHAFPLHAGLGARLVALPEYTGSMDWYAAYEAAHAGDGAEGRLITLHRFAENWTSWEMHPHGDEAVICLEGEITLIQETPEGRTQRLTLKAGEYVINPPVVWHTADVAAPATALFITAGEGTQHRAR